MLPDGSYFHHPGLLPLCVPHLAGAAARSMPYGLPRGSLNLAKFGVGLRSVRGDQGSLIVLQVASPRNFKHVLLMSDVTDSRSVLYRSVG